MTTNIHTALTRLRWSVIACCALTLCSQGYADILSGITGWTSFNNDTDYYSDTNIGNNFTVGASNISVSSLGYYDQNQNGLAAGKEVGIYDLSGTLLASATIPSGTGGTLIDGFRYIDLITPLILNASTTYRVVAQTGTTTDSFIYSPNGVTSGSGVSFETSGYFYESSAALAFPTNYVATMRIAPNIRYEAVPEPSVAILAVLGAVVLRFSRRNQKELT